MIKIYLIDEDSKIEENEPLKNITSFCIKQASFGINYGLEPVGTLNIPFPINEGLECINSFCCVDKAKRLIIYNGDELIWDLKVKVGAGNIIGDSKSMIAELLIFIAKEN